MRTCSSISAIPSASSSSSSPARACTATRRSSQAYREVGLKNGAPGDSKESLTSANGMAQLMAGFEKVCAMPYAEATALVSHPVACIDCHDPASMQLRVDAAGFPQRHRGARRER